MRQNLNCINLLKYLSIPSFLMASANTYKNFFFNDKNGAGNLRILIENEIKQRKQVNDEIISRNDKVIDYQEDILNNQDSFNKNKEYWARFYEYNKDFNKKSENVSEAIKKAIESSKTDQLNKEEIENVRKSIEEMDQTEREF